MPAAGPLSARTPEFRIPSEERDAPAAGRRKPKARPRRLDFKPVPPLPATPFQAFLTPQAMQEWMTLGLRLAFDSRAMLPAMAALGPFWWLRSQQTRR